MSQDLEQIRDAWLQAYYRGDIDQLRQYEHEHLQMIYEAKAMTESSLNRYEQIAHAVKNSVWKPQKPNIMIEEFEFDHDANHCTVSLKSDQAKTLIQELWVFDGAWKIIELKVCKP